MNLTWIDPLINLIIILNYLTLGWNIKHMDLYKIYLNSIIK